MAMASTASTSPRSPPTTIPPKNGSSGSRSCIQTAATAPTITANQSAASSHSYNTGCSMKRAPAASRAGSAITTSPHRPPSTRRWMPTAPSSDARDSAAGCRGIPPREPQQGSPASRDARVHPRHERHGLLLTLAQKCVLGTISGTIRRIPYHRARIHSASPRSSAPSRPLLRQGRPRSCGRSFRAYW